MFWFVFAYALVSLLLALVGIACLTELYRKLHSKSGNWAYNTCSAVTLLWLATGLYLAHNM